jgi:prepilin-type N-terminal cleavage/methylation domain-containing protein
MLTSIKQRMDREDEGFTLIELMVVLLIIAILLAIAIPTFLGARNTANARSTQENLRNGLTAEQTNWTSNQYFNTGLSTLEPSLTWDTGTEASKGAKAISAAIYDATVASGAITGWTADSATPPVADGVTLVGYAKDGNCYAIFQSNNAAADFTAYDEWPAATTGCAQPAASTLPKVAATGSAASVMTSSSTAGSAWSGSF